MAEATGRRRGLSSAELSLFFANLELVYHSGLSLTEGFEILRLNAPDAAGKRMAEALYQAAAKGDALTESLEELGVLPEYALSLLRISEKTGRMEEACAALRNYYEKRDLLAQSIRSSLLYPISMMIMVFVIIVVLLTQAMPVFDQVFSQLGFQMTGLARALLNIGQALSSSAFVIGGIFVVLVVCVLILRALPAGKRFAGILFERAPLLRDLSLKMATQRFALALATMLDSGLAPAEALALVIPLVDNRRAVERIRHIQEQVEAGESFQKAVEESRLFPAETMALLSVGFRTGTDAHAFEQIGQSITLATERRIEGLVAAIEPTLVGIMCVLVGIILLSVMLPLLGVLSSI
ncbi:MAG: type II secretion system F family protein [Coriobacteriales bacterium]|jgi:type IV pilus assembly protein PilC|nr:type II secretion system F family protein [Coriobacteriales bacterium]